MEAGGWGRSAGSGVLCVWCQVCHALLGVLDHLGLRVQGVQGVVFCAKSQRLIGVGCAGCVGGRVRELAESGVRGCQRGVGVPIGHGTSAP